MLPAPASNLLQYAPSWSGAVSGAFVKIYITTLPHGVLTEIDLAPLTLAPTVRREFSFFLSSSSFKSLKGKSAHGPFKLKAAYLGARRRRSLLSPLLGTILWRLVFSQFHWPDKGTLNWLMTCALRSNHHALGLESPPAASHWQRVHSLLEFDLGPS
jgi:hypothetical protein